MASGQFLKAPCSSASTQQPRQSPNPSRGGAVAARRAHNPKVAGSNPAPATKTTTTKLLPSGTTSATPRPAPIVGWYNLAGRNGSGIIRADWPAANPATRQPPGPSGPGSPQPEVDRVAVNPPVLAKPGLPANLAIKPPAAAPRASPGATQVSPVSPWRSLLGLRR